MLRRPFYCAFFLFVAGLCTVLAGCYGNTSSWKQLWQHWAFGSSQKNEKYPILTLLRAQMVFTNVFWDSSLRSQFTAGSNWVCGTIFLCGLPEREEWSSSLSQLCQMVEWGWNVTHWQHACIHADNDRKQKEAQLFQRGNFSNYILKSGWWWCKQRKMT